MLVLGLGLASAARVYRNKAQWLDVDSPLPPASKSEALSISAHGQTILVNSRLAGVVALNGRATRDILVSLTSSHPEAVALQSSNLTIRKDQDSATFLYRGVSAGLTELRAPTSRFGSAGVQVTTAATPAPATLRSASEARGLLIGAAATAGEFGYRDPLKTESAYAATLAAQFSMLEPENAMKWIVLHPEGARYDFGPADELVDFALAHNMKVRGHTLVWCVANPAWLDGYQKASPDAVSRLLHDHINTVMTHYKGKVFAWDVVNEALRDDSSAGDIRLQHCLWFDQPGEGQAGIRAIEQVFRWAHDADPDALLFYNENNVLTRNAKFDAMYAMLLDFVQRGVPIQGVGLQMHIGTNGYPGYAELRSNIRKLTALGLQVHITETDVAIPVGRDGHANAADLKRQAATYERVLGVCLDNPNCTAFQTWGFSDSHSWIPADKPGFGAGLPFDQSYKPKPSFDGMLRLLTGNENGDTP